MEKNNISPMHRKMIDAFGHNVEAHLFGCDKPVIGKCINYTQPLDNDPEVASFDIAVPNPYADTGRSLIEITEAEIETLIIKDAFK